MRLTSKEAPRFLMMAATAGGHELTSFAVYRLADQRWQVLALNGDEVRPGPPVVPLGILADPRPRGDWRSRAIRRPLARFSSLARHPKLLSGMKSG